MRRRVMLATTVAGWLGVGRALAAGEEDDAPAVVRRGGDEPLEELQAVHPRHLEVAQHEVEPAVGGEQLERHDRVGHRLHVGLVLQRPRDGPAEGSVIVDDEYASAVGPVVQHRPVVHPRGDAG